MKIRILDEAISDLRLGAQFYEDQSVGLGTYFLDILFSDIESLLLYAGVHIQVEGFYRLLSEISFCGLLSNRRKDNTDLCCSRLSQKSFYQH